MPYHHGRLREALVDEATELAAEQGPDAVALREVARRVGVSHNAAYRHFADRDALMDEVARRALAEFSATMALRVQQAPAGRGQRAAWARFEASGRAYVEFALTRPGLFRLVCQRSLDAIEPNDNQVHPYAQLSQRLDELVATGAVPARRRKNAEIAAWSAVHGFALLVLDGLLAHSDAEQQRRDLTEVIRVVRSGV